MKKRFSAILALLVAIVLSISLVSCNMEPLTVEDFIKSDVFQQEAEDVRSSLDGQGIDIYFEAEGNKLVYVYHLQQEFSDEEASLYKDYMEASSSTMTELLKTVYDELVDYIGEDADVSVSMEYYDSADKLLVSFTYPES